jgi:hypothetical protein
MKYCTHMVQTEQMAKTGECPAVLKPILLLSWSPFFKVVHGKLVVTRKAKKMYKIGWRTEENDFGSRREARHLSPCSSDKLLYQINYLFFNSWSIIITDSFIMERKYGHSQWYQDQPYNMIMTLIILHSIYFQCSDKYSIVGYVYESKQMAWFFMPSAFGIYLLTYAIVNPFSSIFM